VRQQLVDALLELAGSRPAESISVAELTAAADVSRASFYGHSSSPARLLADTLIAELRPSLDTLAEQMGRQDADYVELWRSIYVALLRHVRAHRAVYEVLTEHESSVSSALTSYFEEAASRYVHAVTARLAGPPVSELWTVMAVSQQAHNMIAVIRAWILTGLRDRPEDVVEVYLTLAPPWQLARPDADGTISLRRTRALEAHRNQALAKE
jgi:AcrR family transcriptional regulator